MILSVNSKGVSGYQLHRQGGATGNH